MQTCPFRVCVLTHICIYIYTHIHIYMSTIDVASNLLYSSVSLEKFAFDGVVKITCDVQALIFFGLKTFRLCFLHSIILNTFMDRLDI